MLTKIRSKLEQLRITWLDFWHPIIEKHPCGCGDWYPNAMCERCAGTGSYYERKIRTDTGTSS